ncbi:hypothetical protein RHSP_55066 [Rhizobium freirei PRF 81]|uniref:Uncharacterized protein n=1 Tax=Rhizobium freirei PRF 81 TaxID=363754 RepID=N6UU63_9HYPH|nr:hypothetical protein RHSP_55066 [Rhizobium freirei PRF 81]
MPPLFQCLADVAEGDALHVRAEITGPDEFHIRMMDGDVVAHRTFGQKHDTGRALPADINGHHRRRACEVCRLDDVGRAFRMGKDGHAGIILAKLADIIGGEKLVNFAVSMPRDEFDIGFTRHVARKIFVREHQHLRHAERFHYLTGVAGGTANIGCRLHRCRCVDISDDRNTGMGLAQQGDIFGRDRFCQRAAGLQIRDQDRLFRIQQLGGLCHEMHAGKDDDVGLHFRSLAGKRETVADDIGNAMKDFRRLVIMRQDDGVVSSLQFEDRFDVILERQPFGFRDNAADTVIQGGCGCGFVHGRLLIILTLSILCANRYSQCEYMSIAGEWQFRSGEFAFFENRAAEAEEFGGPATGLALGAAGLLDQLLLFDQPAEILLMQSEPRQGLHVFLQLQKREILRHEFEDDGAIFDLGS